MALHTTISGPERVHRELLPANQSGYFESAPIGQGGAFLDQHCISAFGVFTPSPAGPASDRQSNCHRSRKDQQCNGKQGTGAIDGHQARTDRPIRVRARLG
jgi:hypothetical protein